MTMNKYELALVINEKSKMTLEQMPLKRLKL